MSLSGRAGDRDRQNHRNCSGRPTPDTHSAALTRTILVRTYLQSLESVENGSTGATAFLIPLASCPGDSTRSPTSLGPVRFLGAGYGGGRGGWNWAWGQELGVGAGTGRGGWNWAWGLELGAGAGTGRGGGNWARGRELGAGTVNCVFTPQA